MPNFDTATSPVYIYATTLPQPPPPQKEKILVVQVISHIKGGNFILLHHKTRHYPYLHPLYITHKAA